MPDNLDDVKKLLEESQRLSQRAQKLADMQREIGALILKLHERIEKLQSK